MCVAHAQYMSSDIYMPFNILYSDTLQDGTDNANDCMVLVDCKDHSTE